jgi:hypothetical protein
MASGRLGTVFLADTANTSVYTVPAAKVAVLTVSAVNLSSTTVKLNMALTTNANNNPNLSEFIEYNVPLAADGGVFEKTGVVIGPSMNVVVAAASANSIAVSVYGFEQDQ